MSDQGIPTGPAFRDLVDNATKAVTDSYAKEARATLFRPGRWYNCWLAHAWGRWSKPLPGKMRRLSFDPEIANGPWDDTEIQERYCSVCNARQLRQAK